MKQAKLILLLFLSATVIFDSCSKESRTNKNADEQAIANFTPPGGYCGYGEFNLLAGQTINVGQIQVGNDATNLYVTYALTPGYVITEAHLYVGTLAGLPTSGGGNPVPGHFPYSQSFNPGVATYTFTIPLASLPNVNGCNIIAAHCVVTNAAGTSPSFNQTGWISGTRITPKGNWGMYNTWCNASCVELPPEK